MNEWYFQRALSKSFKMSPHMTILGHCPRVFVLQYILWLWLWLWDNTTRKKIVVVWSTRPHEDPVWSWSLQICIRHLLDFLVFFYTPYLSSMLTLIFSQLLGCVLWRYLLYRITYRQISYDMMKFLRHLY